MSTAFLHEENEVTFKKNEQKAKGTVTLAHNEPVSVNVAMFFDTTASRSDTIQKFIKDFGASMEQLKKQVSALTTVEDVKVIICTYTGENIHIGDPVTLEAIPAELAKIECVTGLTNICGTFAELDKWRDILPKINGYIVIGDTTDGDNAKDLIKAGRTYGRDVPIITMLDKTAGGAGTQPEHVQAMRALSEASGVPGCPIIYSNATYEFNHSNQITPAMEAFSYMLATGGLAVVAEMREQDILPENLVNSPILEKIANPVPFYQRPGVPFWMKALAALGATVLGIFGVMQYNNQETKSLTDEIKSPAPVILDAKKADQRRGASFPNNSATLSEEGKQYLRERTIQLIESGSCDAQKDFLIVVGHASFSGPKDLNDALSFERAANGKNYLQTENIPGMPEIRIRALGNEGSTPETEDKDKWTDVLGCVPK
ncbi:MAG: OmpA family protein [Alphaproteobacteria bacterium]